jgi:hypothetical protein
MTRSGEALVTYLEPLELQDLDPPPTPAERAVLREINDRVAGFPDLPTTLEFVFSATREILPCDRISLAFLEEETGRVVSQATRADYEPLRLRPGYAASLGGSSLEPILLTGRHRLIHDLAAYLAEHPGSHASRLLVAEGVRSSLTCPLTVEGRRVGFVFRSSRRPHAYTAREAQLHGAVVERLGQAVEKAWQIEQLTAARQGYAEMLGFVSHELKSPIGAIVSDAAVLAEGYLGPVSEPQQDKLQAIARKGRYLLDLVRDYLDLARLESDAFMPRLEPDVDLRRLADEALELAAGAIEERGMRVARDFDEKPVVLTADPGLLRIALVNLVDNAAKYGRAGGELRVSVRRDGDRMRAGVWNEGEGFPDSQRGLLFRRFSRLDVPGLGGRKGTGLGLYNVARIARLHGGRVGAESEPGRWASFSISLPQSAPGAAAPPDRGPASAGR